MVSADGNGAGGGGSRTRIEPMAGSQRPMSLGVILPIAEDSAFGDETPHFADILDMTRVANDVGFDAVWIIDHFVFRNAARRSVRDARRPRTSAASGSASRPWPGWPAPPSASRSARWWPAPGFATPAWWPR